MFHVFPSLISICLIDWVLRRLKTYINFSQLLSSPLFSVGCCSPSGEKGEEACRCCSCTFFSTVIGKLSLKLPVRKPAAPTPPKPPLFRSLTTHSLVHRPPLPSFLARGLHMRCAVGFDSGSRLLGWWSASQKEAPQGVGLTCVRLVVRPLAPPYLCSASFSRRIDHVGRPLFYSPLLSYSSRRKLFPGVGSRHPNYGGRPASRMGRLSPHPSGDDWRELLTRTRRCGLGHASPASRKK
ncbi:hypothetical protein B296_00031851 [Ensete ventricosum]|uniref:Uncharacterized protein n=1 Tax=Ensete ventricosum TaxID=4639 RepID=A0A426YMS1_ENSVE|nr:hypothetical protein B296_00031851 [Ensete ventricosum]